MLTGISAISYASAALAFFSLVILQLLRWRLKPDVFLIMACLMTSLWAVTLVSYSLGVASGGLLAVVTETLRDVSWIAFLLNLISPLQNGIRIGVTHLKLGAIAVAFLSIVVVIVGLVYLRRDSDYHGLIAVAVCMLVLTVAGMLLVEQVFRNASDTERWGIKFACLGIGGMFAYDFYLYSNMLLFRTANFEIWTARGVVDALTAPLIAIAIARRAQWRMSIAVSRQFLFHSVALFGSALYLLCMAAAGYYLRFFGGTWGILMQAAFLFGALLLLAAVLFSGTFRSWLKVFLSKHFYTYNYDYREEWIRFTRTLSVQGPQIEERAIQAIAQLVESPGGALWIARDSGDCEPAAYWNMFATAHVEPVSSPFCEFLTREQWIIDIQDFHTDPAKYANLELPQWLTTLEMASLVVPLIFHGKLFGFIVMARPRSAIRLNWEVLDLLKIAGSQAASYLAQNQSVKALMVARQFESFNRMSTFVVHDIKNLVSQLSLLVSNADKHKDSPEFQQDMLETINYSVEKMRLLLQKFSRNSAPELPAVIRLDDVLQRVVALKSRLVPKPVLHLNCADINVIANVVRFERIISHIVQNAIEATGKEGSVSVRLDCDVGSAIISIADTGLGMDQDFIEQRLFKPFESTKAAGMGIGVFEMREYVLELGGKVDVASSPSRGTTFTITVPIYKSDEVSQAAA